MAGTHARPRCNGPPTRPPSLWASSTTFPDYCDTIASASCPGIYARDWMPVRTASDSSPAIFYLAEIDIRHRFKSLEISLWDPGEGMESMEILDPGGNAVYFTYETPYVISPPNPSGSASPCAFSSYCLDVTGNVFDGRLVVVTVPLSGLDWDGFTDYWFQVRYNLGSSSVDWTTWGVKVVGDPVRLTE